MVTPRSLRVVASALLFVAAVFVAACKDSNAPGGGSSTQTQGTQVQKVEAAATDLMPKGTVAFIYLSDAKELEARVKRVAKAFGGDEAAANVDLRKPLGMFGLQPDDLEAGRPTVVAFDAEFTPTIIAPARDSAAVAARFKGSMPDASAEVAQGFVALTPGPYTRGGAAGALAAPLPAGDLVVRFDTAALYKEHGDKIDPAMSEAMEDSPMADFATMVQPVVGELKALVQASSHWDLALRMNGSTAELECALNFIDPAKAARYMKAFENRSDLVTLAKCVPDDAMVLWAGSVQGAVLKDFMMGLSEIVKNIGDAAGLDAAATQLDQLHAGAAMAEMMGPGFVGTMSLGNGLVLQQVWESPDAAGLFEAQLKYAETLGHQGVAVSSAEDRMLEGVKVKTLRVTVDPSGIPGADPDMMEAALGSILGREGMRNTYGVVDNRIVQATGDDAVASRLIAATKSPKADTALSKAVAAAGPDAVGFIKLDVRPLAAIGVNAMLAAPGSEKSLPPGAPANVVMTMHAAPTQLRTRLALDVDGLAKLIKDIEAQQRR